MAGGTRSMRGCMSEMGRAKFAESHKATIVRRAFIVIIPNLLKRPSSRWSQGGRSRF
jgi:hypothetical protein